jgi:hypothetical protein
MLLNCKAPNVCTVLVRKMSRSVREIFQNSTESVSTHRKCSSQLLKVIKKEKDFQGIFTAMLPFFEAKRDVKNLNNFLQFIDSFFVSLNSDDSSEEFQSAMIKFLVRGLGASSKVARFRSSQILCCYVNNMEAIRYQRLKL